MAVVISQEQNEVKQFGKWGIDIKPHREKMEKRELDKEYKRSGHPLRIVFVCAMWLTGFDVKSLAVMYLDKPLKAHTLMQTIARANRVYEGKSNGLIVDYIGVVKALRRALVDYTNIKGAPLSDPAPVKAILLERIVGTMTEIETLMKDNCFVLSRLVSAVHFEKQSILLEGANAMCASDDIKKKFEVTVRELFKLFKYVKRGELLQEQIAKKNAICAVYDEMQEKRKYYDTTELMAEVNRIISNAITVTKGSETLAESRRFDISSIDFDCLQQEFARVKNKNLLIKDLKDLVEERIHKMMQTNPLRIDYYEQYREIIDEYNAEQNKATIEKTFIDLMEMTKDLDEEAKRFVREGFENDEELAIFDLFCKDTLTPQEIKKVKALSKALLETVKAKIAELDHWTEKPDTLDIVELEIRDVLYRELPTSYADADIAAYRQIVFEHIRRTYPAAQ